MKIAKPLTCFVSIVLGVYAAVWIAGFAQFLYIEKVNSFDELVLYFNWSLALTAAVLCSLFCWTALKLLKGLQKRRGS